MVGWFEIQVPDLEQAKAFYGGVFGWTFKAWMDGYEVANNAEGKMVCGVHQMQGEPAGRHIHVVFNVDDEGGDTLEAALARVTEHGGKVTVGRTLIAEEMGWYATVVDPSGLTFDLWSNVPEA